MPRCCVSFSLPRRLLMATAASAATNHPNLPATSPLLIPSPKDKNRRKMKQGGIPPLLAVSGRNPLCKPLYSTWRSRDVLPLVVARDVHSAVVDEEDKTVATRMAVLMDKLEREGIPTGYLKPGQSQRFICPKCGGGQSKERSFSIFIREDGEVAMWSCFRGKCGWRGNTKAFGVGSSSMLPSVTQSLAKSKKYRNITEEELQLEPLCDEITSYFNRRMISAETLRRNNVLQRKIHDQVVIVFTYRRNGKLINCKYRDVDKKFWQEKDTEKVLYGLDDIVHSNDIIIVEGEMDKLSMEEAGYRNCVSVPDGAPAQVSEKELPRIEEDAKFEYLWNCKEHLDQASRIILATDADRPGQALAEELARRLGKERCWRIKWPKNNADDVCKDANEVLMFLGRDALQEAVENAELYPVKGLFNFGAYFHEIDAYYHLNQGFELGVSTGWQAVDKYYKIVPGELTVVTGVPNSGKSEWIDALLSNINRNYGWKFALCSMENKVREHARKLLEKHIKKPFFDAWYGESVERMSIEELEQGKHWLNKSFSLIRCEDDCLPSVKWVLELAKVAILRNGVRGLVIDPYNELDHQRPANQSETEYVSQMLTKVKRFAQHHSCHVWFVAHPRQLQNWNGGPPNMYDISGSAHFINKCDNGIVIHRNRDKEAGPLDRVQVCVRKVRNKVIGGIGEAFLRYNKITGEFHDIDDDT